MTLTSRVSPFQGIQAQVSPFSSVRLIKYRLTELAAHPSSMELHVAALQGDEKRILGSLLKGEEIDARDDENATPLHLAAWRGALAVCEALVAHGADVNAQDNQGSTPLHFAAQGKHIEVLDFLLRSKADANIAASGGLTSLHLAAEAGALPAVELLARAGANIGALTNDQQHSAAHLAALQCPPHTRVVRRLLQLKVRSSSPSSRLQEAANAGEHQGQGSLCGAAAGEAERLVRHVLRTAITSEVEALTSSGGAMGNCVGREVDGQDQFLTVEHCKMLQGNRYVVIDDVLSTAHVAALHAELQQLRRSDSLHETLQAVTGVREDIVMWVNEHGQATHSQQSEEHPALAAAVQLLRSCAGSLNDRLDLTLVPPPHAMVACYPSRGAHYEVHLDHEDGPGDPSNAPQSCWRE
ncbi:hypothetical protein CYMTET_41784, partial [Cymbomonas tetramitiformis]